MRYKKSEKIEKRMKILSLEKYSRGRRGAPAKGVGRATGARVQIPLSPFCLKTLRTEKKLKKMLTNKKRCVKVNKLSRDRKTH